MKIFLKLFIILIIVNNLSYSKEKKTDTPQKNSISGRQGIILADVEFGYLAKVISKNKVNAALNFTCNASGKYYLISDAAVDSVVNILKKNKEPQSAWNVAKMLGAGKIYFMTVNRIENLLRVEIKDIDAKDTSQKSSGIGFASARYKKLKNNKMVYDPALLTATMRAMAVAEKDSNMFAIDSSAGVKPAPALVIGGLYYINKKDVKSWELYDNKEITSYDLVQTIFENIKDNKNYVVYDIETRDSVYSLFNLVGVENFNAPISTELKALSEMEVNFYITGILERTDEGAILDLFLGKLQKGRLDILKKQTTTIKEDSMPELRKAISNLVKGLVE